MIEIFEALVNILEAEEVHPDLDLDKVKEGRRIAENRVKNLIKTLDSVTRPDSGKYNSYTFLNDYIYVGIPGFLGLKFMLIHHFCLKFIGTINHAL